jgi:LemA protein
VSAPLLLALLAAALLFFWATGAHNRLVNLRNQLAQAAARLVEVLAQRSAAQQALQAALLQPMVAEAGSLQALAAAQAEEQVAARALALQPLDVVAANDWRAAQAQLDSSAARVLALLDQHAELKQQGAVAQPLAAWHAAQQRLPLLRQAYNDAAALHDDALAQFPTRLLVKTFRFAATGRV